MKFIFTIFLITTLIQNEKDSLIGKYSYSQRHFTESLELNSDKTFNYKVRMEFFRQEINGNYVILGDSIVLNSIPQRDKIIVDEKFKRSKKKTFRVTDKSGRLINYHLTITTDKEEIIEFKDCFDIVTTTDYNIKSFHITDTKGLKSPEYTIRGKSSNYFDIRFEHIRVFESEKWIIDNELKRIKPIGTNGEYQTYFLNKN